MNLKTHCFISGIFPYIAFLVGHLCYEENVRPFKIATDEWFRYTNDSNSQDGISLSSVQLSNYASISEAMVVVTRLSSNLFHINHKEIRMISYSIGKSSLTLILIVVSDQLYLIHMRSLCYAFLVMMMVISFSMTAFCLKQMQNRRQIYYLCLRLKQLRHKLLYTNLDSSEKLSPIQTNPSKTRKKCNKPEVL